MLGEAKHKADESSEEQAWTGEAVPKSGKLVLELKTPSEKKDSGNLS